MVSESTERILILSPILKRGRGTLDELERTLSASEVGRLERLGYIETSLSPKGDTWKLSEKGKRMRCNLKESTGLFTKIEDFFFRRILHYHVEL